MNDAHPSEFATTFGSSFCSERGRERAREREREQREGERERESEREDNRLRAHHVRQLFLSRVYGEGFRGRVGSEGRTMGNSDHGTVYAYTASRVD